MNLLLSNNEKRNNTLKLHSYDTFIADLAFLLFVCEVRRNPMSLIIHQMMLDLIIKYQYKWKNFFIDLDSDKLKSHLFLPMALEGAVDCSRQWQHDHADKMPYPYHYDQLKEGLNTNNYIKFQENHINIIKTWYHKSFEEKLPEKINK